MWGMVRSELMKMRHTFTMKLAIIAPIITVLLGYLLSGNTVQYSAYNWWYTVILPLVISLWSAEIIICEKKTGMQNISCLPVSLTRIWISKVISITLLMIISNLLIWGITAVLGYFTMVYISALDGLIGCVLLVVSNLWQIPFIMFLACRIGYIGSMSVSFVGNILISFIGVEKDWFMINPYAISSRIVYPFFKMKHNGIPLSNSSFLLDKGVVFPAIFISIFLLLFFIWMGRIFLKEEKRNE